MLLSLLHPWGHRSSPHSTYSIHPPSHYPLSYQLDTTYKYHVITSESCVYCIYAKMLYPHACMNPLASASPPFVPSFPFHRPNLSFSVLSWPRAGGSYGLCPRFFRVKHPQPLLLRIAVKYWQYSYCRAWSTCFCSACLNWNSVFTEEELHVIHVFFLFFVFINIALTILSLTASCSTHYSFCTHCLIVTDLILSCSRGPVFIPLVSQCSQDNLQLSETYYNLLVLRNSYTQSQDLSN